MFYTEKLLLFALEVAAFVACCLLLVGCLCCCCRDASMFVMVGRPFLRLCLVLMMFHLIAGRWYISCFLLNLPLLLLLVLLLLWYLMVMLLQKIAFTFFFFVVVTHFVRRIAADLCLCACIFMSVYACSSLCPTFAWPRVYLLFVQFKLFVHCLFIAGIHCVFKAFDARALPPALKLIPIKEEIRSRISLACYFFGFCGVLQFIRTYRSLYFYSEQKVFILLFRLMKNL